MDATTAATTAKSGSVAGSGLPTGSGSPSGGSSVAGDSSSASGSSLVSDRTSARGSSPSAYRLPLFYAVTALFWFSLYTYVSFFTNHVETKGATHAWAGIVLASYGFTQTVLRIPLGMLSDRLGTRKPFVVGGLIASTVSAFGFIYADSPIALMICRGLAGVAAASWVAFTVLYSSYFPPGRSAQAVSTIMIFLNAGSTLGMFIGGRVAHFLGSSAAFVLATLSGLLGLGLSNWVVDNFEGAKSRLTAAALLSVARQRRLLLVSSMALILQAVAFATVYGFTPVYAEGLGATKESLANLALISSVPAIIANYLVGRHFIPRMGEVATAAIGFLLIAAFTAAIPWTGTMLGLYATQLIAGFGRGMALPVLMGLCIKDVPDDTRATAMGVFQAVYGIGMVLGPVIAGIVGDLSSLHSSFVLMGGISLAAAALCAATLKVPSRRSEAAI